MTEQNQEITDVPAVPAAPVETARPEAGTGDVKTFTQSQVDAILRDRLTRKDKQYADYTDLQDKAKRLTELEEAAMNEQEKAVSTARQEVTTSKDVEIAKLQVQMLISNTINEHGRDILPGYRNDVTGKDEAEILESIKGVLVKQEADIDGRGYAKKAPAPDLGGKQGSNQDKTAEEAIKLLTPAELDICRKSGCKPEDYLKNKRK